MVRDAASRRGLVELHADRGGSGAAPSKRVASDMAATRTKTRAQARPPSASAAGAGRRSLLASRPSLRGALELEPHQVDVLALALIAVGIFLAGVAYLHWAGGTLGDGARRARSRFVLGALGYACRSALVLAGALILARDWRPPTRPLRTGVAVPDAGADARARGRNARDRPGRRARPRGSGTPRAFEARGGVARPGRAVGRRRTCSRPPAPTSSPCSCCSPA